MELQIPGSRQGSVLQGWKLNGGTLLCPHSEPLCHPSPFGFRTASAGMGVGEESVMVAASSSFRQSSGKGLSRLDPRKITSAHLPTPVGSLRCPRLLP